ncbi:MAG: HAD family hydrolase [Leptonema sp. (in: Bacteria)]|nr:HAD family hydrolase [Leptonema sp. (in: bacteria)]
MAKLQGINAILFDVDGTLFSSEDILYDVYHTALKKFQLKHGRPETLPGLPAIMQQIGQPVKKIFQNLVPELTEEERDEISNQILIDLVNRIEAGEGIRYDGVFETIQSLADSNIRIFAASNGRKKYVQAILKSLKIIDYFEAVPTIDNVKIMNKNELVACILDDFGLKPKECIIVGDRATDRDAGILNEVSFVATSYGHHSSLDEHNGAVATIDSFSELLELVL